MPDRNRSIDHEVETTSWPRALELRTTDRQPQSSASCTRQFHTPLALSSNRPPLTQPVPDVSRHTRRASHEAYDFYDPATFTTSARQRQQPAPVHRPSTSHSIDSQLRSLGSHPLRRVLRQSEVRQSPHRRAVSLDSSETQHPRYQPAHPIPVAAQQAPEGTSGIATLQPALSEAQTDRDGSTVDDPYQLLDSSYWPRRTTRVSSRTVSAILFALENAIRQPIPFTTDWEEANASMSDMVGVAGPAGPVGNGRVQNGSSRMPQGGAPQPPSGVRTPTDIMRQRRDREARRKAEQEAREKEQEQQSQAHTEQYAAGVADDPNSQARARVSRPSRAPGAPETAAGAAPDPRPAFQPTTGAAPSGRVPEYQSALPTSGAGDNAPRPAPASGQQPLGASTLPAQNTTATGPAQSGPSAFPKPGEAPPTGPSGPSQSLQQPRRASFPHAFERWETLSSHWEGLTSYWIRKLEQNSEDLERDPVSQQLARQITDLSAAGANLFHAVVELQRLRASSERKFQRWFFDTRAEQERAKEVQADLERQLKAERQNRADAFAAAQNVEQDKTRAEELLREMRRELQISKEEARRAWEELGRREQEERDRTNSLRNGEPTLVGGVQVVPMIQGVPSRHDSRPPTREGPYPGGPTATTMGGEPYQIKGQAGQYYEGGTPMSPTDSDPFTETKKPMHTTDPATSSHHASQYYDPEHPEPDDRSYVGSSEPGDDEFATYPPLSEESDDYDQSPGSHYVTDGAYTEPPTSAPLRAPYPPTSAIDYSGAGWGVGSGWESMTPRHRHPTRLSDVLEEDEPSRTSPSRASQASRSIQ